MPAPLVAVLIILSVLVFIGLIIIISNIKVVKQTEKIIVERLGAYRTTWGVGIHMLLPFFDRIAVRVSMKEQVRDFDPQSVITKDNVTMQIDTVVFYVVYSGPVRQTGRLLSDLYSFQRSQRRRRQYLC